MYVVAVPNNDLVATHASLWIWPRAPGPAQPDRVRLPLGDPAALQDLKGSFSRTVACTGNLEASGARVRCDMPGFFAMFGLRPAPSLGPPHDLKGSAPCFAFDLRLAILN